MCWKILGTSAAPLTYWAWPPMREGCCSLLEDIVCLFIFGEVVGLVYIRVILVLLVGSEMEE